MPLLGPVLNFALLLFFLCFLIFLEVLDVKLSEILSQPLDFAPKMKAEIYARNKKLLAQFYSGFRYYAKFEEIPATIINAVIATEDKNFFSHRGVDLSGLVRALWHNIWFGDQRRKVYNHAATGTHSLPFFGTYPEKKNYRNHPCFTNGA